MDELDEMMSNLGSTEDEQSPEEAIGMFADVVASMYKELIDKRMPESFVQDVLGRFIVSALLKYV